MNAENQEVPEETWEQLLGEIFEIDPPKSEGGVLTDIALQLEAEVPGQMPALRPLRQDENGAWSFHRASWRELTTTWKNSGAGLKIEQLETLKKFYALIEHHPAGVALNKISAPAWNQLKKALSLGVKIFTDPAHTREVKINVESCRAALDLSEKENFLELNLGVMIENIVYRPPRIKLLGNPVWGAWIPAIPALVELSEVKAGFLAKMNASKTLKISPEQIGEFWCQWAPGIIRRSILGMNGAKIEEVPQYLDATLNAELRILPENPSRIHFVWNIKREEAQGRWPAYYASMDINNPGNSLLKIMHKAGLSLGLGEKWRELFTQTWPLWEAGMVRNWVADLNRIPGIEAKICQEVKNLKVAPAQLGITLKTDEKNDQLFELNLEASIGKTPLAVTDLLNASVRGQRWWNVEDTWVDLHDPAFLRALQIFENARQIGLESPRDPSSVKISMLHLALVEELEELVAHSSICHTWRDRVHLLLQAPPHREVILPGAQLRDYQKAGVNWLGSRADAHLGAILADDMGLGKTIETLGVIASDSKRKAPVLIVVPTSVRTVWMEEAHKFFPHLKIDSFSSTLATAQIELSVAVEKVKALDVIVTTYALVRMDKDFYSAVNWEGIVLDEAQFIKNPDTVVHKVLKSLKANWRFALSGTPIENRLLDLWSITDVVLPGIFPARQVFNREIAIPIETGLADKPVLSSLHSRIKPFLLRRTKAQVQEQLPARIDQVLNIDLNKEHRRVYSAYAMWARGQIQQMLAQKNDGFLSGSQRMNVLTMLTQLRQLALSAHLGHLPPEMQEEIKGVRSEKIDQLVSMLQDLKLDGHKALVFSQFTGFLSLIRKELYEQGIDHCYLDGTSRDREAQIEAFKSDKKSVFLISLKAGGFGLNLTGADYVFLCDPWWNPAVEEQAISRAHRTGQQNKVHVYKMISSDTVEQRVMALALRKRDLMHQVVSDDKADLLGSVLTLEDLRELFE